MISLLISRLVIVVFGFLYPAFSSYKAIKTKDIRLYVKWMMYWIVFALFISLETFTDIFFSFWFPFYYELKIILVFWLLSPVTRGSSIMYRRVIHPLFMRREQEIDELIARAKDQGYNVILEFGCKGVSLATNAIMNTAVKNVPSAMTAAIQPPVDRPDSAEAAGDSGRGAAHGVYAEQMDDDASTHFSETDDEYQTPRKKTRKSRKRDSSVTSTRGSTGLLFQLKKSYSLNDLVNAEVMDRVNEIKRQSKNDCNRIDVALPLARPHTMYVEDSAAMKMDSRSFVQSLPSTCDNIATEQNSVVSKLQTDVKNGKNSRQRKFEEPRHTPSYSCTPRSINPSKASPSHPNPPTPPLTRESVVRPRIDYKISDRRDRLKQSEQWQSCEAPPKPPGPKQPKNACSPKVTPCKWASTPDLSPKNEQFWLRTQAPPEVDECSRPQEPPVADDSSPAVRRRRRRKRTAPKPPESWPDSKVELKCGVDDAYGAKVPCILVDESKMASNWHPRKLDGRYLNPLTRCESKYAKRKPRSPGSKLRQFLSRSRELLTQWRSGGELTDDSHSTNSHSDYVAASSDDSYSTTSSRCNSTLAPLKDRQQMARRRQTKKRTI